MTDEVKTEEAKPEEVKMERIGTIVVATEVVQNGWKDLCDTLFRKFCPVYVSVSPDGLRRAYIGFCDDFDEIESGSVPPKYKMNVDTAPTGERKIVFTKFVEDPPEPENKPDEEAHGDEEPPKQE